ncbi:RNA 3'-phosphate cyclase [Candidatus Bathyarchaeota archaeon]|nr:RNA 3'-phosphate cyclase [Candidatus Bathyarchaeota archaeon]MBS7617497.1 RNA 3'-phosphate cyclase [Candidatus Bathyarchaeota archaeon]
MITIQGDMLEGGGQILRMSTSLSALLGEPVRVVNVRGKRKPPGLARQHMTALKVLSALCDGYVEGLNLGSTEVIFNPGKLKAGSYKFDVGTAGSVTLILQAAMPVMAFTPGYVKLTLVGGTNNPMAPPVDYIERVLLPNLRLMGVKANLKLNRRGFYPKGGGEVEFSTEPVGKLEPITLDKLGEISEVRGLTYSCRLPEHIVNRMALSASEKLSIIGLKPIFEKEVLQPPNPKCSLDPGCGLILTVKHTYGYLGVDRLGVIGKRAELIGSEAAEELVNLLRGGYPMDKHLCDQLIVWASLADGVSRFKTVELTLHTLTCIELSRIVLNADFKIDGGLGRPSEIECRGVGFERL